MVFSVSDSNGKVVITTFHSACTACIHSASKAGYTRQTCAIKNMESRIGCVTSKTGSLTLCCDCSEAKTTKLFKDKLSVFQYCIPSLIKLREESVASIKNAEHDKYSRIVHNLKTLNAQSLLNQYNFISQEVFANNHANLLEVVESEVVARPKDAAIAILQQSKNNEHMKTEFASHEKLSIDNPVLYKNTHVVYKVILNVYHSFAMDFYKKYVKFQIADAEIRATFDYDTVRVAFYHIFSNAIKYVSDHSTVVVNIVELADFVKIEFKMRSLRIYPDEVDRLFEDHFSGKAAISAKLQGTGFGMGLLKKALSVNKGSIEVVPGEQVFKYSGKEYAENSFVIQLPKR